jgi:hypothetical protein
VLGDKLGLTEGLPEGEALGLTEGLTEGEPMLRAALVITAGDAKGEPLG